MRVSIVTVATAIGLSCSAAQAEHNWYTTAKLGFNSLGNQTVKYVTESAGTNGNARFDAGFAAGGALGYAFDDRWRLEGEILYRTSELEAATVPSLGTFSEGDYSSLMIALNGFYDFELFGNENIKTYLGAGLGWLQEVDIDFENNGIEQSFSTDDLGIQAMFGARYNFGESWFVDAELRYFFASDVRMRAEENAVGSVTADYDPLTLAVSVGLKF